ncbi:hypothetical protein NDU88_009049 [Pleurodeles waltl]|uniref:Uncharacterized protein n=1 Tax=Pleurodeles waltl TaxID=8319 RepID=A0AAV7QTN8_PLEWA|nr:hypothetical protein NDU88_009049 [Pleurodeles waltl]
MNTPLARFGSAVCSPKLRLLPASVSLHCCLLLAREETRGKKKCPRLESSTHGKTTASTARRLGPAKPRTRRSIPGGTTTRIANLEVESDTDIREREAKGEEEKREAACAGETAGAESEERVSSPSTGSRTAEGDIEEDGETDDEDAEKPRDKDHPHHVPGGACLSQVQAYLIVKVLPEWMWVERK